VALCLRWQAVLRPLTGPSVRSLRDRWLGDRFVAELWTLGGNGDPIERHGAAIHLYTAEAKNRWQRVQAFRLCTDDVSSSWIGPRYIASCAGRA
jgi:hypothetical protein